MSPYLKQNLPLGILAGEVSQASRVSDADKLKQGLTSIGWRMHSLNKSVDTLLHSASRLEEEMERETRYWEQILAIKERGWSISRLPRERHTLAVRYGFAEAHADFRDRGLAALRRDAEGNVSLDRGIKSGGDRKLRVRILHQGEPIGSSMRGPHNGSEEAAVEKEILDARNSIFDEELHQELHREARSNLTNQGVRVVGSRVIIPYEADKQVELDLVPLEDNSDQSSTDGDFVANTIAISLRILLTRAHRQNLRNRSNMPPPLREQKPPRRIYDLLKPIVEWLQHRSNLEAVQNDLQQLKTILAAAQIYLSFDFQSNLTMIPNSEDKVASSKTLENLLESLIAPIESKVELRVLIGSPINIVIHTALQHYGTSFQISLEDPPNTGLEFPMYARCPDLPSLRTHLLNIISLMILQNLLLSARPSKVPWRAVNQNQSSIMRNRTAGWRDREMVSINVSLREIVLSWEREGYLDESSVWAWPREALGTEGEQESLLDVFKRL